MTKEQDKPDVTKGGEKPQQKPVIISTGETAKQNGCREPVEVKVECSQFERLVGAIRGNQPEPPASVLFAIDAFRALDRNVVTFEKRKTVGV